MKDSDVEWGKVIPFPNIPPVTEPVIKKKKKRRKSLPDNWREIDKKSGGIAHFFSDDFVLMLLRLRDEKEKE